MGPYEIARQYAWGVAGEWIIRRVEGRFDVPGIDVSAPNHTSAMIVMLTLNTTPAEKLWDSAKIAVRETPDYAPETEAAE